MTAPLVDEAKERVRQAADIVEVVSGYIPLKRAGQNFKALCPFHNEKTPSFMVNPSLKIYKCFGCGAAGDVFSFLQAYEKLTFPEALRILASRYGIPLEERTRISENRDEAARSTFYKLNALAAEFYHKCLLGDPEQAAKKFLLGRGMGEKSVSDFKLGFSPKTWDAFLRLVEKKGFSHKEALGCGLLVERVEGGGYYDRFRNRVMFPIFDAQSRVIGFGARKLDSSEEGPKYINTPETAIFDKGSSLYGLDRAKGAISKENRAVVVEGYTDCIMAHQEGIANVVATLGTALTRKHLQTLRRYAGTVVLVFDADEAGLSAAERAVGPIIEEERALSGQPASTPIEPGLALHTGALEDVELRVAVLETGKDPCEFVHERGKEAFIQRIQAADEVFDFWIKSICKRFPDTIGGRTQAARRLLAEIEKHPDPGKRTLLWVRISEVLHIPESELRELRPSPRREHAYSGFMSDTKVFTPNDKAALEILESVLVLPELVASPLAPQIYAFIDDEYLREVLKRVFEHLGSASRPASDLLSLFEDLTQKKLLCTAMDTSKPPELLRNQFDGAVKHFERLLTKAKLSELRAECRESTSKGLWEKEKEIARQIAALEGLGQKS